LTTHIGSTAVVFFPWWKRVHRRVLFRLKKVANETLKLHTQPPSTEFLLLFLFLWIQFHRKFDSQNRLMRVFVAADCARTDSVAGFRTPSPGFRFVFKKPWRRTVRQVLRQFSTFSLPPILSIVLFRFVFFFFFFFFLRTSVSAIHRRPLSPAANRWQRTTEEKKKKKKQQRSQYFTEFSRRTPLPGFRFDAAFPLFFVSLFPSSRPSRRTDRHQRCNYFH